MHALYRHRRYLAVATVTGWLVFATAALPGASWGETHTSLRLLVAAICCVGSVICVLLCCQKAADELYQLGKEAGRREALREFNRRGGARILRLQRQRERTDA